MIRKERPELELGLYASARQKPVPGTEVYLDEISLSLLARFHAGIDVPVYSG
jgi:hypothetical protein